MYNKNINQTIILFLYQIFWILVSKIRDYKLIFLLLFQEFAACWKLQKKFGTINIETSSSDSIIIFLL